MKNHNEHNKCTTKVNGLCFETEQGASVFIILCIQSDINLKKLLKDDKEKQNPIAVKLAWYDHIRV